MLIEQTRWTAKGGWQPHAPGASCVDAQLVLVFGSRTLFREASFFGTINAVFPNAVITGCSTAGEICGTEVTDESLVCTAVKFERSQCEAVKVQVERPEDSRNAGITLSKKLRHENLCHVLVFSDGLHINGTELVSGIQSALPPSVTTTGGLAADGELFQETYVFSDGAPAQRTVIGVGLYGNTLRVGCGSFGGWDPFGPERLVTRSSGNILYELDGVSALSLYKQYLGEYARELPASGLLFPLAIRKDPEAEDVVRTILGIREEDNSMTFAGDIPEGHYARFMKCNMDRLIDGSANAARATSTRFGKGNSELALLISCVGRKMVLKQRVEEEVECVRDILGQSAILTGFYSYGEISPGRMPGRCELQNQTMTITTFSETSS